jgi:DNA-binding response OmpR family regulator
MMDDSKHIKLLLVDDEEDFRLAAVKALTRQGFVASEADGGEKALEILSHTVPDVMILDLRMGGMDGITTLEKARKIAPELPVIILTGHGRFEDALAGIRLEIVDFLQKPVDMADLGARIRRLLSKSRREVPAEKGIAELMVPASAYRRFYVDQTVQEIVTAITDLLFKPVSEREVTKRGRRAVLVFDRQERFVGLIRVENILSLMVPACLKNSPYSSYFTGMFLAQTKMIGRETAGELIGEHFTIEADTPLMEALNLMVIERLTNLAITEDGKLVGILRDEDIFKEISDSLLGR